MSTKIEWGSNESFIENYIKLKSSRKMGKLYGCDKASILNHAKNINFDVKSIQTLKLSNKDKEYIKQHYEDMTSTTLSEKFNVSRGMITKLWHDAGLKNKTIDNTNKSEDVTNKKFGYLTAICRTDKRLSNGGVIWKCSCSCGREKCLKMVNVPVYQLKSGLSVSCGAIGKENLLKGRGLNFNNLTNQKFGKLTVIKRIVDKKLKNRNHVQYECVCECGRKTKVLGENLITGNTQTCGLCGENSHGNTKIDDILQEANIPFVREKRFDSCKDILPLPFDFYVDNKYLIEYDGKQHFKEQRLFDYEGTRKHDKIKDRWCKENNIPLIRIPYTHYKDLCLNDLKLETTKYLIK